MIWLRFQFGPAVGMGHAVRSLVLARVLRDAGCPTGLILDSDAGRLPAADDFPVFEMTAESGWPEEGGFVFDLSHSQSAATLRQSITTLKAAGRKCAVIDGLGPDAYITGLPADLVLTPYLMPADTQARRGTLCVKGPEYAILDPAYGETPPPLAGRKPRLLIAMGGADPWALTETALDAVKATVTMPRFDITVVAGAQLDAKRRSHLAARCRKLEVDLLEAPDGLRSVLCESAVAILGPGLTKYEAAATDTPAVILAPDSDAFAVNRPFAEAGLAYVMEASTRNFAGQLGAAIGTQASKRRSSWSGRTIIDGQGACRAAAAIRSALGE